MTARAPAGGGEGGGREGKRLIYAGIAAFAVTCVALFLAGGRLAPTGHPEPGFAVDERARPARPPATSGTFQVTLDASDRDRWVAFDLKGGQLLSPAAADPAATATPADLVLKRYALRAPHGAIDLGKLPLDRAHLDGAPAWSRDERSGGELQNPALRRWYSYSYWTHDLRSLGSTYAVRLAGGGVAYLNVVSYYCKPEGAGCLTLRYRLDLETTAGR